MFEYDPSLIHTRAGYWFRDIQTCGTGGSGVPISMKRQYGDGIMKDRDMWQYLESYMHPRGYIDWVNDQNVKLGTRPVFCIY